MIRLALMFITLAVLPAPVWAAGPLQRYALVVGANPGGASGGRIEIVVYYSGHADEKGLLFGGYRNFNGVQVSIGIGWLFGAGYPPQ